MPALNLERCSEECREASMPLLQALHSLSTKGGRLESAGACESAADICLAPAYHVGLEQLLEKRWNTSVLQEVLQVTVPQIDLQIMPTVRATYAATT